MTSREEVIMSENAQIEVEVAEEEALNELPTDAPAGPIGPTAW
ncbi:hypothetical protein [Kitasatospora cineracea]